MKTQDKNLTKEKIINSGIELFANKGFAETSVREIAKHSGVNLSMISYHFGGKEGLQEAIFHNFAEKLNENLDEKEISDKIEDKVKLIVNSIVKTFSQNPKEWKIVFRELINQNSFAVKIFSQEIKGIALKLFGEKFISGESVSSKYELPIYILGPAITAMTMSHFLYKPVIENVFPGKLPKDFLEIYPSIISTILIDGLKKYFEGDSNVS